MLFCGENLNYSDSLFPGRGVGIAKDGQQVTHSGKPWQMWGVSQIAHWTAHLAKKLKNQKKPHQKWQNIWRTCRNHSVQILNRRDWLCFISVLESDIHILCRWSQWLHGQIFFSPGLLDPWCNIHGKLLWSLPVYHACGRMPAGRTWAVEKCTVPKLIPTIQWSGSFCQKM